MVSCSRRFVLGAIVSVVLCLGWSHSVAFGGDAGRYEGYPVVRVVVETEEQLAHLKEISESVLSENVSVGVLDVLVAPGRLAELERAGLSFAVLIQDVQVLLDHERASRELVGRGWYDAYKTNAEINAYLDSLVTAYPTLISKYQIGTSVEARAIYGLTITSPSGGPDKPALCFNGTQHAREWISPMTVVYLVDQLVSNYDTDPTVQMLLDELVFYVVPVVNPDGYVYSWLGDTERWWRKNRRDNGGGVFGVDLNRNWDYEWGGAGSSSDPSDILYHGPAPFSEPETQALRDYILGRPEILAHIDFHSYGQLILRPWGYDYLDPSEPDFSIMKGVGDDMADTIYSIHGETYVSQRACNLYPATGTCSDWVYGGADIYSYTVELRDTGYYTFILPPEQILPTAEENYAAVLVMAEYFTQALDISFPSGLPAAITAGSDTTISVMINPVNQSIAEGTPRLYYRYDPSGPFIEVPLTALSEYEYEAVLPATNCTSTPEFYFSAQGDAGSTTTSPANAPGEVVYSVPVQTGMVAFFEENLSTNPGWTVEDQWAWGQPTGGGGEYGGPDPTSGHTGDNVYGYNLSGDYANDIPERHLTTNTPIDCTGHYGVRLSFWRWLGVEQPAYDHAFVRVSNNGTDWVRVWENAATITDDSWTLRDIDISAVADNQPTVYLRWTMGSTDGGWRYCGWNIDDIELSFAVCEGLAGDHNGDGGVDDIDFGEFVPCFAGPGGVLGPGCGIFDFDSDEDVDCGDWSAFEAAWTGSGNPPYFAPCGGDVQPPTRPIGEGGLDKPRYISLVPASAGLQTGLRVTFSSLPGEFSAYEGTRMWVGQPVEMCENSGQGPEVDPEDCGPAWVGGPVLTMQTARLQADRHCHDFGSVGLMHVTGCEIVPGASYTVQAIDCADDPGDEGNYSSPLAITTSAWGNICGPYDVENDRWGGPDSGVDIVYDVTACVGRFKNEFGAPMKARADIDPNVPDGKINVTSDITKIIDAFGGDPYTFPGPGSCP